MEQAAEFKDKQAMWEKKCTGLEERLRKAEERERMLRDMEDDGFGMMGLQSYERIGV